MKNLIFLDIDGCLNSIQSGTMWKSCLGQPEKYSLNQENIDNVKYILDNVIDSEIVWITSWRNYNDTFVWEYKDSYTFRSPFKTAREAFKDYPQKVAEHLLRRTKSDDIWYYLCKNYTQDYKNFCIIDDECSYHRFKEFYPKQYFYSDMQTGVTKELADQIIEYFKNLK